MVNNIMMDILKRKVESGEIKVDEIISTEYKAAIIEWQNKTA